VNDYVKSGTIVSFTIMIARRDSFMVTVECPELTTKNESGKSTSTVYFMPRGTSRGHGRGS
jgi:hypothetical protein